MKEKVAHVALGKGRAQLNEAKKWIPLIHYLRLMTAHHQEVALGFRQIEDILGDGLPKPARNSTTWWDNDLQTPHAAAWISAGWRVHSVNMETQSVLFIRHEMENSTD